MELEVDLGGQGTISPGVSESMREVNSFNGKEQWQGTEIRQQKEWCE